MNPMAKNLILWVVIALVLMSVFNNFGPRQSRAQQVEYSRFISDVKSGRVQKVVIEGRSIQGVMQNGERFSTYTPESDNRALVGARDHAPRITRIDPQCVVVVAARCAAHDGEARPAVGRSPQRLAAGPDRVRVLRVRG